MILLGLDCNDFDIFVLFLKIGSDTGNSAACTTAGKKVRHFPISLCPNLWPSTFIMSQIVGIILVLIWHIVYIRSGFRNGFSQSNTLISSGSYSRTQVIGRLMQ